MHFFKTYDIINIDSKYTFIHRLEGEELQQSGNKSARSFPEL